MLGRYCVVRGVRGVLLAGLFRSALILVWVATAVRSRRIIAPLKRLPYRGATTRQPVAAGGPGDRYGRGGARLRSRQARLGDARTRSPTTVYFGGGRGRHLGMRVHGSPPRAQPPTLYEAMWTLPPLGGFLGPQGRRRSRRAGALVRRATPRRHHRDVSVLHSSHRPSSCPAKLWVKLSPHGQ